MKARDKYGVKYPALYASEGDGVTKDDALKFNCIQRAHQNCLENLPSFLSLLVTAGYQYPRAASAAGVVYLVEKWMYFDGYSSDDPQKRRQRVIEDIGLFHLIVMIILWTLNLQRDFWQSVLETFYGILVVTIFFSLIMLFVAIKENLPYIIGGILGIVARYVILTIGFIFFFISSFFTDRYDRSVD